MRKFGEKMGFTGGGEIAPFVEVRANPERGMHYAELGLLIQQNGQTHNEVFLSPQTMRAILAWYEGK
jgi:hypothetical protein